MKAEVKELVNLLENGSDKEVAKYLNESFNYYRVESGSNPANYYEITEDYSITIDFNDEEIYSVYYSLHEDELKEDLKEANLNNVDDLIEEILEKATPEEITNFYQYSFTEIDQELAERYISENRDKLKEDLKIELLEKNKEQIQNLMDNDYSGFIEALISIETNIDDIEQLEKMYENYYENDFNLINDRFEEIEFEKSEIEKETIKEFNPHIKFWSSRHNEYERENFFTKEKEIMHRIRLPKESKYSEYSLDTKIKPKENPDGKTSYITIDKDFQYKLIAPEKKDQELDWSNKKEIKISGYELKKEFGKDKSINDLYKNNDNEKDKVSSKNITQEKDNKTKSR